MSIQPLRNIPVDQVAAVVQSFLNNKAIQIIINKNNNGTYDIEATIPD
ncbi:hypothetical protein [Nitrosomonas oligotropha]|nr:hypothetical protein [Nitrosomonas oligotropha]